MVEERHLPPRDTRWTEIRPFVEHRESTKVLLVELIAGKATLFIFQFTLVNFSYTQFFSLPLLIFATILFKPKGQVFFFREQFFYECMVYHNKRSLFRYD